MKKITTDDLSLMFANPLYCLPYVRGWKIQGGKAMVTKEEWKIAAKKTIDEVGIDQFLDNLLFNIETN